jgi:hypothetical protein
MKFYEKEDILLRSPDGTRLERYWPALNRWVEYLDVERAWEETREIGDEQAAELMAEEDGVSREAARLTRLRIPLTFDEAIAGLLNVAPPPKMAKPTRRKKKGTRKKGR